MRYGEVGGADCVWRGGEAKEGTLWQSEMIEKGGARGAEIRFGPNRVLRE